MVAKLVEEAKGQVPGVHLEEVDVTEHPAIAVRYRVMSGYARTGVTSTTLRSEIMASIVTVTGDELDAKVRGASGAVALDFYQASCPPCRALEPRLERVAREYEGRLVVYRIDIDRDMPVAERFGVKSIPTIMILRGGREVERLDGLITDRDLHAAFERALSILVAWGQMFSK